MTVPDDGMVYFYRVHGLLLASEIDLPELAARRTSAQERADVYVRRGEIDAYGSMSESALAVMPVRGGGAFLQVPGAARFLVRNGSEVIVAPNHGVDLALIRVFLLGWVTALVCYQRSSLVLHASAVAFGDQIVAFAGKSGEGKSTIAAHCVEAGGRLMADDLIRVSVGIERDALAYPGLTQFRLTHEALTALNWPVEGRAAVFWRDDKFWVPAGAAIENRILPLARVYILEQDPRSYPFACERLTGVAAITPLVTNMHGWIRSLDVVGRRAEHFRNCVQLASTVHVIRLRRRLDAAQLPIMAAHIAASMQ
jgi:hypothetical protein